MQTIMFLLPVYPASSSPSRIHLPFLFFFCCEALLQYNSPHFERNRQKLELALELCRISSGSAPGLYRAISLEYNNGVKICVINSTSVNVTHKKSDYKHQKSLSHLTVRLLSAFEKHVQQWEKKKHLFQIKWATYGFHSG